jgi:hypothetical protein
MAFQSKRFLRNKIMNLQYRIKDLEERLCPCEIHDWKWIDSRFIDVGLGNIEPIRRYKCQTCGKEKEDIV